MAELDPVGGKTPQALSCSLGPAVGHFGPAPVGDNSSLFTIEAKNGAGEIWEQG